MRSQSGSSGQESEHKKSVFDRLGRQLDSGCSMNHRPSPGYGDYMPPMPVHEADFGRYGREPPMSRAEMEWRYHNDRRHMPGPPFSGDRHQMHPMGPPPGHYDMEMAGRQQSPYYPHPAYQGGPLPPPSPNAMGQVPMHQRRGSPKYDRHGNLISGFKERGNPMRLSGPMDHHHGISPPRNMMPTGPIMHPGGHDMLPMRSGSMYPPPRWHENIDPEFPPGRMMQPEDHYQEFDSHRYQMQPPMMNPEPPMMPGHPADIPRYIKWRERRDVITSLDRETAQSSSRTDSLRSSLQQSESRSGRRANSNRVEEVASKDQQSSTSKQPAATSKKENKSVVKTSDKEESETKPGEPATKTEPQDISDGEIVDDEDSSDESEIGISKDRLPENVAYDSRTGQLGDPYRIARDARQYYEPSKKRRLMDRDDYALDYETISDEDLDDFMEGKKEFDGDDSKLAETLGDGQKNLSEIELLNALGLDWANLVEMAKQSKTSNAEATGKSALPKFSLPNYLPTLGITADLAGHELFDLVQRVCQV